MAAIRRRDTKPEVALRSALHRRGHRFRKDLRVDAGGIKARPDIVFTRRRLAIFVDGCFWHSCPEHGRAPRVNEHYWSPKLAGNRDRDWRQASALESEGWLVLRLWEHESVTEMVAVVERTLAAAGCQGQA
jgi:DNA mismatch endonuclease (patch repair protein)